MAKLHLFYSKEESLDILPKSYMLHIRILYYNGDIIILALA